VAYPPVLSGTARAAIDLIHVKVADLKGNPLMVSGVVTYGVVNARKAALDVTDVKAYIQTQGLAVMKKIASMYPYEAKEGEHSLKTEASRLRSQMIALLQDRCDAAGVQIVNFELTDLAYAPEIANAMLIRQQAEAMVDARKIIVEGAVQISMGALHGLAERGVKLSKEEEAKMVSNLLVVICGDSKVQPTVNVG
jgi:regulator of protease activity HflC (stomatin/prohibitin superfamily)